MRPLAVLATVLTFATAHAAAAQPLALTIPSTDIAAAVLLNDAAFAPKTLTGAVDPIGQLIERQAYRAGVGPVLWTSGETRLSKSRSGGVVDSLRVSVGGTLHAPGGLPLALDRGQYAADAYEVALIRDWPAAFRYGARAFDVDLTPHAGVGVSNLGGSAEAGATIRLSQRLDDSAVERLKAMGLSDGADFGDQGRWYLFAAASGRAVGLNMLHGDAGWNGAGWSTDPTSTLIGDAQVGLGWRKGSFQTSLGYIHREIKGQHMVWGQDTRQDSVVAFSLSIRPKR